MTDFQFNQLMSAMREFKKILKEIREELRGKKDDGK